MIISNKLDSIIAHILEMINHCASYPSSSFRMVFFSIKYRIIGDRCRAKGILTIVLHDNDQTDDKLVSKSPNTNS